jgi:uncharacterized repeat protein (TIGR03803 family)
VLYAFKGGKDGWAPFGQLALDQAGNLYGATFDGGGTGCSGRGCGTVFEVTGSSETVLSKFNRAGGPEGPDGVIRDQNGNLFGATAGGGAAGCGTVFEVPPGKSAKTLYSFSCGGGGSHPIANLLMDGSGNLYGTTPKGKERGGKGVVFELKK